jgi:ribonuclease P protein component
MEALFKQGKSFSVFPVKVLFRQPETTGYALQTGVGAGSRHFKRAVHRNRIKRLMRESYRLHAAPLQEYLRERGQPLVVFLLYIDKVLPEQELLHQKMPAIIRRLIKELNEVDAPAT